MRKTILGMCLLVLLLSWGDLSAFHNDIYQPRVPAQLLDELQDMDNPYPPTAERIQLGREVFYGKGVCVTCHNSNGEGKKFPGHSPRDFTDKKWQEVRTDGEMMWVLRNGSPGTQMPVRVGKVINEEEGWSVIHFIRTLVNKE